MGWCLPPAAAGTGLRPDKIHRSGLFVWAVRRGLELAGARLSLADGEADPVLALETWWTRLKGCEWEGEGVGGEMR